MNPWKAYRKVKQETTTPQEAVLLAYGGIIAFLEEAKEAMLEKDYARCGECIFRARRLLSELTIGLNDDVSELADNFRALYNYCYRRTIDANLQKDPNILDEVLSLLRPLQEAWIEGLRNLSTQEQEVPEGLEEKVV